MTFGEKVRQLRLDAGISQNKLAEMVGVSRRSVIYYEQDKAHPARPEVLKALADVLGVTADELCCGSFSLSAKSGDDSINIHRVVSDACALFASDEVSCEEKTEAFNLIAVAYSRSTMPKSRTLPKKKTDGKKRKGESE